MNLNKDTKLMIVFICSIIFIFYLLSLFIIIYIFIYN